MRYRNISGHAEDLADGRVVGYLGEDSFVELSDEDLSNEFNKQKIDQGAFIEAPEPEVTEPTLEDLKNEARELEITGFSSMNKEQLQQAINEAKTAKFAEGDSDNEEGDG